MRQLLALLSVPVLAFGQAKTEAVFTFDIDNVVAYYDDGSGYAKTGTSTARTPLPSDYVTVFRPYIWLGDIVAVNGAPAKGTLFMPGMALGGGPTPVARRPIYDVYRNQVAHAQLDILDSAGGALGVLCFGVLGADSPSPGSPRGAGGGAFTVVGGTGAFLGVIGQGGTVSNVNFRSAPFSEDPGLRRVNGGGMWTIRFLLAGLKRPEIVAAYHAADFTPVSAASPARPGETVILAMRGMGPTTPTLEPDTVFTHEPLQRVAATVDATVNGKPAACFNAVGWPDTADTYRLDLTLPGGFEAGKATVVVNRAFIPGIPFELAVRQ